MVLLILELTVKATVTPMLLQDGIQSEGLTSGYRQRCAPVNVVDVLLVAEALDEIHPICYAHHHGVHKVHSPERSSAYKARLRVALFWTHHTMKT